MLQIPHPGDGFLPPPGTMRYVLTFEELLDQFNAALPSAEVIDAAKRHAQTGCTCGDCWQCRAAARCRVAPVSIAEGVQLAVEQWLLSRRARFDVRSLGCDELPPLGASPVPRFQSRGWAVTMTTPWHVYTVTTPRHLGFSEGLVEVCKTIDRLMVESGQALSMGAVPNNRDSRGGSKA